MLSAPTLMLPTTLSAQGIGGLLTPALPCVVPLFGHPDSGGPRGFRLVVELITLALLWQIFAADERDGIPKSVFQ